MKQGLRQVLMTGASQEHLDALSALLAGESRPDILLFKALLSEGCSPTVIQSVLLEHRDGALMRAASDADQRMNVLRFSDQLQFFLLQALAAFWQGKVSELESRLSLAGTELQMASARSRWVREGEVTLYNYFCEVPIMARVAVLDVRENGFGVERSADLVHVVAAGQYGRFAYIRLPDRHTCLRLDVESVAGNRVNFRYAGIFRTARERRQHIRVMCEEGMRLSLSDLSGARLDAALRDMSQSGFGLGVRQAMPMQVGNPLGFELKLPSGELAGLSTVRWLRHDNIASESGSGQIRFGLELHLNPSLLRRLQAEVARRQKRLLGELRMLGVPDSLI